jgi:hypothetical protein
MAQRHNSGIISQVATQLVEGSRPGPLFASNPVLEIVRRDAVNADPAPSMFSSEDGGVMLPPPSAPGSVNDIFNLATIPEQDVPSREPFYLHSEDTVIVRAATAHGPVRAKVEATVPGRYLSAATNHRQYASYRREYDRTLNVLKPMPTPAFS